MNSKDFTIGVLSVTAVILLVGFLLLQAMPPQAAMASGQGGTIGEYIVSTEQVDEYCEVITILDTATQRMNFYQLDLSNNQLAPLQWFDAKALAVNAARNINRGRVR
jgi:hypothetical protein